MKERSDEELLDSLYGERADRLDAEVGAGGLSDDDDLDQLRRLRGMFAELKASQEEPPPAGMALLMAAARQAAEERKPKQEGLWAKLRAGWAAMVAHPAMAAATAAVVVIGASGYLMSRGVKTAESTYSASDPSAASRLEQKSAEGASDGIAPSAPALAEPASPAAPLAEPADPAPVAADAPAAKLEPTSSSRNAPAEGDASERQRRPLPKKAKPSVDAREELGGLVEGGSSGGASADKGNRLDDSYAKQNPGTVSGSGTSTAKAPVYASPPPPPPPPPASAPEPEAESASAAEDRDDAAASKDEAKKKSGVESITQQSERWYQLARDAAAKGDCNAVRLLAERVLAENPGFYEKRFKKDATVAKCL